MTSRCSLAWLVSGALTIVSVSGCSDALNEGSLQYIDNDALAKNPDLAKKPALQAGVRKALHRWFGADPKHIRVPAGSGLTDGGLLLGNYMEEGDAAGPKLVPIYQDAGVQVPTKISGGEAGLLHRQEGGYAIYRRNCLHCHGVSGAGDGPTAPFLYPPPRDYRKGIFKFTSTPYMKPPHRDDLRRTIKNGLHGTSMPSFDALLSQAEIEQVVEYVMFLSMRGETELALIDIAAGADENDQNALSDDVVKEAIDQLLAKWKLAQTSMVDPPIARTPSTRESIVKGRDLFLQSDCKDCHGLLAKGDGASFVNPDIFNEIVFGGNPSEIQARIDKQPDKVKEMWKQKPDEWGNPLRPANLNRGIYKGGRRPIDIYWRIAKGINGAQMPGHYPALNEKQIWDVVNFVLALPYEPELLTEAPPQPATGTAPAVAERGRSGGRRSVRADRATETAPAVEADSSGAQQASVTSGGQ